MKMAHLEFVLNHLRCTLDSLTGHRPFGLTLSLKCVPRNVSHGIGGTTVKETINTYLKPGFEDSQYELFQDSAQIRV